MPPRNRHAGFAMLDVLAALLLLALTLTGACLTLLQTLRASHEALLATRAVDLAADLAEELQGAASAAQVDAVLSDWRTRVRAVLPVADMEPGQFASLTDIPRAPAEDLPPAHELTLRWRATSTGAARELRLPLAGLPDLAT